MFERPHLQQIIKRMADPRKFIQVIFGPRQVGKTTLVNQMVKKYSFGSLVVSADAIDAYNTYWLEQQWELARIKLTQSGGEEFLLVVDEIQKIDNWSEKVKSLWDQDTKNNLPLKVIVLGSSRLLIQQGLTESLAGRFETTFMSHWSYSEMLAAFGWNEEQYVYFGGYPGAASLISDQQRWKQYVRESLIETSISKDILMLTRVDKPALMKRLFELSCTYSGQILSYNKMLGQLRDAGNTTTLSHYLTLLSTAGLVTGIEKYSSNIIRKKSSSPKFQVYNTALISALSNESFEDALQNPAFWGRLVESAVGVHLLNHSVSGDFALTYWREGNDEVDFVIEQKKLIGIEVKSGAVHNTSGMAAFKKKFNPDKLVVIGNTGLPLQEFLLMKPEELFS
ncbi:MAG: ATP-binding protein [Chitinophagaceae bacterium]|nr:ATP-binding protein [Chitinophagaceae bacterium]